MLVIHFKPEFNYIGLLFYFDIPSIQICLYVSTLSSVVRNEWLQNSHVHQWICHSYISTDCAPQGIGLFFARTIRNTLT